MSILSINPLNIGSVGNDPTQYMINTDDTLSVVTTAGYLTDANGKPWSFKEGDYAAVKTTNAGTQICQINLTDGVVSLSPFEFASVTLAGTSHQISVVESPAGTWTISTPQDIDVTSSVTFSEMQLSDINAGDYTTVITADTQGNLSSITPTASTPRYVSNTGANNSPEWSQIDMSQSGVTGVLPIVNGGTNSSASLGNGLFMVSNGGAIVEVNQDTSMNNFKIINLADPTQPADAVNKNYADNLISGLTYKAACVFGTTSALPSSTYNNGTSGVGATLRASVNGLLTVDGIAAVVGYRILVKNQASTLQNGIYVVSNAGSVSAAWLLTRANDFNQTSEIPVGATTFVSTGTVNEGTTWAQTATVTTIGTSPITFAQVGGAAAVTIIGTTNQINVLQAGSTYTLSTPQDIATSSSVTFANLTLTNPLTVPNGGTGNTSFTTNGLLYGQGTSNVAAMSAGADGQILQGNTSAIPSWTRTPVIGLNGSATGTIRLRGATSGTVTIQPQAAAGTFNFNLPITSGSVSTSSTANLLQSGGGSSTAMSWASATSLNTASTIVMRDASGNFSSVGINVSGLTASQAVVTDSSKNLASLGYSSIATANFLAQWDSSANFMATTYAIGYSAQTAAGGTNTLTATSGGYVYVTGDLSSNLFLPDATTLKNGAQYTIVRYATTSAPGDIVLRQSTGGALVTYKGSSIRGVATLLDNSTAAGTWQVDDVSTAYQTGSNTGVMRNYDGGIGSSFFFTATSNGASTGFIRMASTDAMYWRNNGNSANLALSKNTSDVLNWVGAMTLGAAAGTSGSLGLIGTTSGQVNINIQAAAGSYNYNLPITAGSASTSTTAQLLRSQGGGATAMDWLGADSANTVSTLVLRNSSGNFSAGTITATLTGAASNLATADDTSDTTCFPLFANASGAQASQSVKTNASFTFDASLAVLSAVNIRSGYTTTATAAGTTTLTSASTRQQYFTGTTTQTVVLPATSTLALGWKFEIYNNSTGLVTLQSSGANTIRILDPGSSVLATCILTSGTGVASWSAGHASAAAGSLYTNNQTGTTYTFALTDGGATVTANNASSSTYTLPQTSNIAFPIGSRIKLVNLGAGAVTLVKEGSETLLGNVLLNQYATSMIEKTSATQWQVFGGTAVISEGINGAATGTIVNQAYDISVRIPFGGTIISMTTKSTTTAVAGTYTVAISGVSVTGLTTVANGASGVRTNTAATAANTFVTGDYITVTLAGATITDLFWTLEYTRAY